MTDLQNVPVNPQQHPITNPGTRSFDELFRARHLALMCMRKGSVFSRKVKDIQSRLLIGEELSGIAIHQFIMQAELALSDEELLMPDTFIDVAGVGPSADLVATGSTVVDEAKFQEIMQHPNFEARLNPDDPNQVGIIHVDEKRAVQVIRVSNYLHNHLPFSKRVHVKLF